MMSTGWIGRPERQREHEPLLTGLGTYAGDFRPSGLCQLAVCRSALAHGLLRSVDLTPVRRLPGVLGAWSLDDLPDLAAGLEAPSVPGVASRGRSILATGKVRYAGEPIAVVAAGDAYAAADALAAVRLDLEPLAAVIDVRAAAEGTAPTLHDDLGTNVAAHLRRGFGDAASLADQAPIRVRSSFDLAQVAGAYLEPRAVTAWFDHPDGTPTLWTSTQWTFGVRDALRSLLGMDVRVLAPNVGGAFGPKGMPYPEEVLAMAASRELGRPVQWVASRSEDTAATAHGHGTVMDLELAAGPDGRLLALRGRILHTLGAYAGPALLQVDNIVPHLINAYRLPALEVEVDLVYTNSVPAGFVRGGGRPIGNFGIERMLDLLAHELGDDPLEVRRRNLVRAEDMPYDTGYPRPGGTVVYDGGDYSRLVEMASGGIDYQEVRGRQARGEPVGVGVACVVESTGFGAAEDARISIAPDGRVQVWVGTTPQGQGHETIAAQVAAERLGWPAHLVRVTAGDSSAVAFSVTTSSSRSAVEMGNAVARAAATAREQLLARAAAHLEVDAADVELGSGGAGVRGVPDRRVPLAALVGSQGLEVGERYDPQQRRVYSSGCHAALVRLDPETGGLTVERYVIAHDAGRLINPRLVEGQMHGGYAHGLGYALLEEVTYDSEGSPPPGTFLDYLIPGAPETAVVPELRHIETPSTASPEGFRGAGESGTIPVPAAVASAIEDCARQLGHEIHLTRLPLTPEFLYRTLERSHSGGS